MWEMKPENEPGQSFAYMIKGDSAVILRCFSRDSAAELPAQLEGYPVTELAPYAFSAHMSGYDWKRDVQSGRVRLYVPEAMRLGQKVRAVGAAGKSDAAVQAAGAAGMADAAVWAVGAAGKSDAAVQAGQGLPADIDAELPELAGNRLKEVVLPPSLRSVGRYCFYNCSSLARLEFSGGLCDWGSGAFTGCHHVSHITVHTDREGKSSLKEVLDELREELMVEYHEEQTAAGASLPEKESAASQQYEKRASRNCARLVFPEFYEEGVENTPARILETHVHGSGIFFRNCFRNKRFDFAQYDILFPHVIAQEAETLTSALAVNRLRFPYELSERAKYQYETYVLAHRKTAADALLAENDVPGIRWLLELDGAGQNGGGREGCSPGQTGGGRDGCSPGQNGGGQELEEYLTEKAARLHMPEVMSCLMEYRRAHTRVKRRRFEL